MEIRVTPELSRILGYARDESMRTGHYGIGIDHLLLGVLRHGDNDALSSLGALGIDAGELRAFIDSQVFRPDGVPYYDKERVLLTRKAHNILSLAVYEALRFGQDMAGTAHLMLAISRTQDFSAASWLEERGVTYEALKSYMFSKGMLSAEDSIMPDAEDIANALEAEIRAALATTGITPDYLS